MIRIGIGKDLHSLEKGRPFLLGGILLPWDWGEAGHSDGDVLAHAVIDAILGAACLGDIGEHFPPSDPSFKDADSMDLLRKAYALVQEAGWCIVNLDCVVVCENPKILPNREAICSNIATLLKLPRDRVSVKGKTNEKVDAIGAGRAVEATAVCLLEQS